MENQRIVDILVEKIGKNRFTDAVLKICTSESISELNFKEQDIDDIILPLVQIGFIKVENRYFQIRPDKNKTRYNIFSVSYKGKEFANSILAKLNLTEKVNYIENKYSSKFLAFMLYFFKPDGRSIENEDGTYKKLIQNDHLKKLISDYKKDLEKIKCAFLIKEHRSKKIFDGNETFIILPAFLEVLEKKVPREIVNTEMEEFNLENLIERYLLKPQAKEDWYEEFLNKIEMDKLQNLWPIWKEKFTSENILQDQVVLDVYKLKEFLSEKISKIQRSLTECSQTDETIKELLKIIKRANIVPGQNDLSEIASVCQNKKDFSVFISAVYRIMHDQMSIKDETVDPIRCYFHHGNHDKRQELNKAKFEEFCKKCMVNFEPKDDEWQVLKDRVLKIALDRVRDPGATK